MSITFEGLDRITDKLDKIIDTTNLKKAMGKACALVERSAKIKAPKGTGGESGLRGSIKSKIEGVGADMVGVVYTPLEYAPYVEFGTGLFAEEQGRKDVPWHYQDDEGEWHSTSGMKPQPYLRPALNENREQIKEILKGGLLNND